ncbi:MAG TPA: 2TM domain-containing protein [Noviherbaspirillum sp.]|uniref:2TM domain-containing protein n=1 Tax=Noviherbaspirillum sp. TaxID=1926288 RepID=UPI002D408F07|nr:2TM domain-containing protein [Noviherbaspirillum sp.]HYD97418.1 2TM domain-containing protein [Noviherbaspirillum sp.]
MDNTEAYRDAKRHVERKVGFFIHLAVYLVVNAGLILFNLLAVPGKVWAVWPLLGWGIGLLFHGLAVFLYAPGAAWKERMIDNEMKKRER